MEGVGLHQCCSLLKHHLLRAHEPAIPTCRKPSRRGTRLPCLNRQLLWEKAWTRKLCALWNPGQEKNTQMLLATCHCGGKAAVVKAQLEMQAARSKKRGGTTKRVFLKHVDGKQRCRKTITPLQDVDGHLTNRDRDMVRVFHKFFAFASCLLCLRLQHSSMPPSDAFSFSFHIFQVLYCLCV